MPHIRKTEYDQQGSILLVSLLALVLIGAGLLMYMRVSDVTDDTSENISAPEVSIIADEKEFIPAASTTKTYLLPIENMAFDYPENWKLYTKFDQSKPIQNNALLVSPNNFFITFSISNGGPDWPFGERIYPCWFDDSYDPEIHSEYPECPVSTKAFFETFNWFNSVSMAVFREEYLRDEAPSYYRPTLQLVKNYCTGLDIILCDRPDSRYGLYIYVVGQVLEKIDDESLENAAIYGGEAKSLTVEEFLAFEDTKTAMDIMRSLRYVTPY